MARYRIASALLASLMVAGCGERELVAPQTVARAVPAAAAYPSGAIAQVALGCVLRTDGTILCWGNMSKEKAAIPPGNYRELSVGGTHNCALTTADAIVCWGSNSNGETSPPGGRFAHVSSGSSHSCALGFDGSLVCWGKNDNGQAAAPPGIFTQVSASVDYTCAIRAGGALACWGVNTRGQVTPPAGTFSRVSAGVTHACAVRGDGAIVCWGRPQSDYGQASPPAGNFIDVNANEYTCGTKPDRSVVCWGVEWRTWGHPVFTPAPPPPGPFMQVSTGYEHACGLTISGEMVCWGYPEYSWGIPPTGPMVAVSARDRLCFAGAEGNGRCIYPTTAGGGNYADFNWIRPLGSVRQVSVGIVTACAVGNAGGLSCWGWDHFGDTQPPSGTYTNVSVNDAFACAVRIDGQLACWGHPSRTSSVDATQRYLQVSVGDANSCAIRTDGTLYCWPASANTPSGTFTAVSVKAALFSPSGPNYCAIRTDGTLVCWNSRAGTPPPPSGTFTRLSVGSSHACALRADGTIACWGDNANGKATPPEGQFSDVTAGGDYSCAIRSDRRGVCWGGYVITESSLPSNRAPTISVGGPYLGDEGAAVALAIAGSDPDGDPLTFTWDFGDGVTGTGAVPPTSHTYADNGSYTVRLTVSDGQGGEATAVTTATIANVAPSIPAGGLSAPATPVRMSDGAADVAVSLRFSDPAGPYDSYSAAIACGNGTSLTPSAITSPYAGSCRYTRPGIYTVSATVSDEDGGTSALAQYQYVLVYDPAGSFVTGGGWLDAPASACSVLCGENSATKAHFTIVARFSGAKAETPEGAIKFWLQGKKALDVRTTRLTMLIAWDNHLQLWGPATVNGAPNYTIRVSGLDQGRNDLLRVELFDPTGARVYDTQWGVPRDVSPTTPVQGGQLTIHPR